MQRHGRFIESVLVHCDKLFANALATALCTFGSRQCVLRNQMFLNASTERIGPTGLRSFAATGFKGALNTNRALLRRQGPYRCVLEASGFRLPMALICSDNKYHAQPCRLTLFSINVPH